MKKLKLAIAMIALLVSCQKENLRTSDTGKISFNPIIENYSTSIKKDGDVNRGGIPVYVSAIDVFTENDKGNTNTTFTLVENRGADLFILENLPLGETTIRANSKSNSEQIHRLKHFDTKSDAQNEAQRINPYVEYTSANDPTVNLKNSSTENVDINMKTENGRMIMYFYTESGSSITDSYELIITIDYSNSPISETLTDEGVLMYYWSNEDALDGAEASVQIEWANKNTPSDIIRSDLFTYSIKKGISSSVNVIIKEGALSTGDSNLNFIFTPIIEQQESDIVIDGTENTTPPTAPIIDLDFLKYDDLASRRIGSNGEVIGKTTIGDFIWYANDMEGQTVKTLAETNFSFDAVGENVRLTIYLTKDGTNKYKTVYDNAGFDQLKIDYADYFVRTDYTRSYWGNSNVNFLLRIGDDDDTEQEDFRINSFEID